jgi:hypothetical protein
MLKWFLVGPSLIEWKLFAGTIPFSTQEWIRKPDDRTRMIPDLIEKHRLIGMTREEVVALLGPFEFDRQSAYWPVPGYGLGMLKPGRWNNTDGETLLLKFDESDRVAGMRSFWATEGM